MNRRIFLKSLAAACGAAVVCPGELLKSPVKFRPNPTQKTIIENARQQGMTVTIYDEFVQQNPYIDYPYGIPYWVLKNRNETYQT